MISVSSSLWVKMQALSQVLIVYNPLKLIMTFKMSLR